MPWRGALLGFALMMSGTWLADRIAPDHLLLGYSLAIIVGLLPIFVESASRRDFVTASRFVHRYGLLGNGCREVPLDRIERIAVDRARYESSEEVDYGDLDIHADGSIVTIAGIADPDEAVRSILEIRDRRAPDPTVTRLHPGRPAKLSQALTMLGLAVAVALSSWLEHAWRLGHGDYPGVGMRHTWYWYATTWIAFVVLIGWVVVSLARWLRE